MTPARQSKAVDAADTARAGPDDPVLSGLRQVEAHYLKTYELLQERNQAVVAELAQAKQDNDALRNEITATQRELDDQRVRAQRQQDRTDALALALKEIHRTLFRSSVYDLILKACLSLTGATRGLYLTIAGENEDVHIRAAVDVDKYPSAPPSKLIIALTRAALDSQGVEAFPDTSALPEAPGEGESFQNCLVAPAVLRNDLSGVVIVADKAGGAFDQDDVDVLLSVGNQAAVAIENNRLQREVHEAYLSIVTILARTMAARSQAAGSKDDLGCRLASATAERLGLPDQERSLVYYAALLHDIGNIGVSDGVLNKPGPLLEEERELIRAHVQIGKELLHEVPVLGVVAEIVRHHHERFDGEGYPDRLRGEEIPIAARIVAVADAYFAMLSTRSYRPPLSPELACEELRRSSGSQFDPRVVDAFLSVLEETKANVRVGKAMDAALPLTLSPA
jgi:HD-GYP domain-containing protein (c-di-GMP phosphodiesterase class II)